MDFGKSIRGKKHANDANPNCSFANRFLNTPLVLNLPTTLKESWWGIIKREGRKDSLSLPLLFNAGEAGSSCWGWVIIILYGFLILLLSKRILLGILLASGVNASQLMDFIFPHRIINVAPCAAV